MQTKELIGLALLSAVTLASIVANCFSWRIRDVSFFLLIAGAPWQERMDFNLFSHFWYRGTTRGFDFSALDALAIGLLAAQIFSPRPGESCWRWPASLGLMLLYFCLACVNVFFSNPKIYGAFELLQMAHGILFFLVAFVFVRSERELGILVLALCCTVCLEGALALKQRLLTGIYRVAGTLDDANSFSMYLCTVSPIFIAAATSTLPKWVRWSSIAAIAAAAVSIVMTISRAGLPIFATVMLGATVLCVSWKISAKKIAAIALVALCVGGLLAKQWYLFEARWSSDSLKNEYESKNLPDSRGYYLRLAKLIVADQPLFGVGLNNWSYWVSKKYAALVPPYEREQDYDDLTYAPSKEILPSFMYAAPAHDLAALTVGELGVPGLIIFALLWLRWFQMGASFLWPRAPDSIHRLGVGLFFCTCGIFGQSITEWVFRQAPIYLTYHLLLGALASLYWIKRKTKRREIEIRAVHEEEMTQYEPLAA